MLSENIYERRGTDSMTQNMFFTCIGGVLTYGFIITWLVSGQTLDWQPSLWTLLLVGLGLPLVGIVISASDNPGMSFLGFNLVTIPFGAILGPVLAHYEFTNPGLVGETALLTAVITSGMAISGLLFPKFYRSIGGALFVALSALLVVYLLSFMIPSLRAMGFIHYIAAAIFALYIGFDMYRASQMPATLDNAIDVAISLYLDIINLFLALLRIKDHD